MTMNLDDERVLIDNCGADERRKKLAVELGDGMGGFGWGMTKLIFLGQAKTTVIGKPAGGGVNGGLQKMGLDQ
jgi:hypothetical protein